MESKQIESILILFNHYLLQHYSSSQSKETLDLLTVLLHNYLKTKLK